MSVTEYEYKKGFPALRLTHPNSTSSVELLLYGAHVYSWTVQNKEILFLSDKAVFEQGKAIRGGVPLVWPQFGPGPLPQHGFARVKPWRVTNKNTSGGGDVSVELQLSDDQETLKLWPNKFNLTLTVRLSEKSLVQELTVENRDEKAFEFTALYHTYFNVDDIKTTKVSGLNNVAYLDKVDAKKVKTENQAIEFTGETDRVYKDGAKNGNPVVINGRLQVTGSSTMSDVVVWNPGQEKAKAAADIGEENYPKYVCVEIGHVDEPVKLDQGQTWKGAHQMTVLN